MPLFNKRISFPVCAECGRERLLIESAWAERSGGNFNTYAAIVPVTIKAAFHTRARGEYARRPVVGGRVVLKQLLLLLMACIYTVFASSMFWVGKQMLPSAFVGVTWTHALQHVCWMAVIKIKPFSECKYRLPHACWRVGAPTCLRYKMQMKREIFHYTTWMCAHVQQIIMRERIQRSPVICPSALCTTISIVSLSVLWCVFFSRNHPANSEFGHHCRNSSLLCFRQR